MNRFDVDQCVKGRISGNHYTVTQKFHAFFCSCLLGNHFGSEKIIFLRRFGFDEKFAFDAKNDVVTNVGELKGIPVNLIAKLFDD